MYPITSTVESTPSRRIAGHKFMLFALLGSLGAMQDVTAQPGYANMVKNWCSSAGRPAPAFTADECSTCHASNGYGAPTAKKSAFLAQDLNVFCPAPAVKPNSAPNLVVTPSGAATVATGSTLTITASATDPDQDPVVLKVDSLPSGSSFDTATGVFSWTPTSGSKGVYTLVINATDQPANPAKAKTVQQTVTIRVTEPGSANVAPQLDTIPSPQAAPAQDTLKLRVTALDADDDDLTLSAANLPAGAQFTDLGLVNGKWTGELSWQPGQDQVRQHYLVTFVATEVGTSPTLQDAQDVDFQVTAPVPDASVRRVVIDRAKYRNGRLRVQGKVKLKSRGNFASSVTVTLTDGAGAVIGQTNPSRRGNWSFSLAIPAGSQPCRVQADVNGAVSAIRPVKPASTACGSTAGGSGNDRSSGGSDNGNGGDDHGAGGSDDNGNGGGDHDNDGNDGDHDGND